MEWSKLLENEQLQQAYGESISVFPHIRAQFECNQYATQVGGVDSAAVS